MRDFERVVKESIDEIRPREEDRLEALNIYEEIRRLVEGSLHIPYDFTVELHGSVAKGTELRNMIDLDIFLLIRYDKLSREWLESEVVKPLFNVFRRLYKGVKLKYATHPYIYLDLGKYEVDVVPAYWARDVSEIKTAVDRTPFHTRYVLSKLTEEMRDEVRLLKAFFKGAGVYGAEIKVEGFSGYLTELLIIKYGSFLNTLMNIAKWRFGEVVIVDESIIKADRGHLRKIFRAPLIIPDPVDPERNAASAVSAESLAKAVLVTTIFLKKPSKELLLSGVETPRLHDAEDLCRAVVASGREAIGVLFKLSGDMAPDVVWGKLKSIARSLIGLLQRAGFSVISYSTWTDELSEAVIIITVIPRELPPYEVHLGPPLGRVVDIDSFVSKYYFGGKGLGPYVGPDGRIFTLRQRRYVFPRQVIEGCLPSLKVGEGITVFNVLRDINEVCKYISSHGTPELLSVFRRAAKLELF